MSDDDPEIIEPPKKGLPAKRSEHIPTPVGEVRRISTGGVVRSWLTGLQAESESKALDKIAERHRSESDIINAQGGLADAYENTAKKINRLRKLPRTLALDDAKYDAEHEAEYAKIKREREERNTRLDFDHDEGEHRKRLDDLRREREIDEANAKLVEAKRGMFNASQGLENQERLKQLNMEMWEKRAATQHMDAEKIWMLLRREIDGIKNPQQKAGDGSLEQLAEMRASLVQRAQEAAASGDASQAEKYDRLAAELDDLVVSALRAQK